MSLAASTFRWLQKKRYQYEVTFSLYMLTPTEKFIFNSFLFLFFSMILIAMTLYLPHHIAFLNNRAWFYYNGDENAKGAVDGLRVVVESAGGASSAAIAQKLKETVARAASVTSVLRGGKEL